MKRLSLILASLFIMFIGIVNSQNQVPVVEIISNELTSDFLNIEYLISDDDNSAFEVSVLLSLNNGVSYDVVDNVTGDVGQVDGVGMKAIFIDQTEIGSNYIIRIVVDDKELIDIEAIVATVDSNSIMSNLKSIEGIRHFEANLPHLEFTRSFVLSLLENSNLDTSVQYFPFIGGNEGQNLFGQEHGVYQDRLEYIVGGHYDTVDDSPGADDNGTAVAAMVEIAKVFKNYNFDNSIRYATWDQEEAGLLGSTYFVNSAEELEILGYLNFEMLGYYSDKPNTQTLPAGFDVLFPDVTVDVASQDFKGNFLTNVGNGSNSNQLMIQFDSIASIYVPELRVISVPSPGSGLLVPDLLRSDHAPFWVKGLPALMLTDASEFRNPNYHTEFDVVDSLDMNFLTNNVKASVAYLAAKAGINHKGFASLASQESSSSYEEEWNLNLQLNPNPVSDILFLELDSPLNGNTQIVIRNIEGIEIIKSAMLKGESDHQIDMSEILSGKYILEIRSDQGMVSKLFVVVK